MHFRLVAHHWSLTGHTSLTPVSVDSSAKISGRSPAAAAGGDIIVQALSEHSSLVGAFCCLLCNTPRPLPVIIALVATQTTI